MRAANGIAIEPFIPLEFAAADRFGHIQVPGSMRLRGGRTNAVITDLFGAEGEPTASYLKPRVFTPIRTEHGWLAIDWNLFAPIHGAAALVQHARRLDTTLADPLAHLATVGVVGPGGPGNLAGRNLTRGRTDLPPSG